MNKINQKNHIEDIVMEIDDAQVRTIQIIHTMVKQIDQLEKRFKESSKNKKELADIVEIKFVGIEFDYDKVKQGEKEANKIAGLAARRGTKVHKICEDYLNNMERDFPDKWEKHKIDFLPWVG